VLFESIDEWCGDLWWCGEWGGIGVFLYCWYVSGLGKCDFDVYVYVYMVFGRYFVVYVC